MLMNRLFKSIALALAVVLTLNLAACAAPAVQTPETAASATEAAPPETAAAEESKQMFGKVPTIPRMRSRISNTVGKAFIRQNRRLWKTAKTNLTVCQ